MIVIHVFPLGYRSSVKKNLFLDSFSLFFVLIRVLPLYAFGTYFLFLAASDAVFVKTRLLFSARKALFVPEPL